MNRNLDRIFFGRNLQRKFGKSGISRTARSNLRRNAGNGGHFNSKGIQKSKTFQSIQKSVKNTNNRERVLKDCSLEPTGILSQNAVLDNETTNAPDAADSHTSNISSNKHIRFAEPQCKLDFGFCVPDNMDSSMCKLDFGFNFKTILEDETREKDERDQECILNFNKLIDTPEFKKVITSKVKRTPGELLLMTLKFSLSKNLSISAIIDLLMFVNNIFNEPILMQSRYMLDKMFNNAINIEFHAMCHKCNCYLGDIKILKTVTECTNIECQAKLDLSNASSLNYFMIIDPSKNIQELLTEFQDYYLHVTRDRTIQQNHIKDIYDGKLYREFVAQLSATDRKQYLTAVFNTDGAPKFESSGYSIWPIYLMINEIPMEHRHPMLCGLWFGKHKPDMIPFLNPFVKSVNKLSQNGIPCEINGEKLQIKLFALCACVDTIARAPMQGIKQFNGFNGCNWCLHPGDNDNSRRVMRYPYIMPAPKLRNRKSMVENMRKTIENGCSIDGIMFATHLIYLMGFDIVEGFVPDYMHLIPGVAEQFTELLMSDLSDSEKAVIDRMMLKIKAPKQIVRLTRAFSDRRNWKAREWENWVLYYSMPILSSLKSISQIKLKHWSKLVQSLHILLGTNISLHNLEKADILLHQFVASIQLVYESTDPFTYNVHQLLHLAPSVLNWGPLWAHSAFLFEASNRYTLQAIKCARGVIQQIARIVNLQYGVSKLEREIYPYTSKVVQEFCENLKKPKSRSVLKTADATYFGKKLMLQANYLSEFQVGHSRVFQKMVKNGCLFTTSKKENERSCNYYAKLYDGRFVKINKFIVELTTNKELTLCNVLETEVSEFCDAMHFVKKALKNLQKIETKNIATVCVYVQINDKRYIFAVPNLYHY